MRLLGRRLPFPERLEPDKFGGIGLGFLITQGNLVSRALSLYIMAVLHPSFSASQVVIMLLYPLPKTNMAFLSRFWHVESLAYLQTAQNKPHGSNWMELQRSSCQDCSKRYGVMDQTHRSEGGHDCRTGQTGEWYRSAS